ncbi:MAG: DUF72 domain-containing protein [Saprospiraceae bacterium]|jgi:uncharacterized protein YecE (DUF72 family)|uniref:DUF72 domain-containing protein n=1 Tax=Candidatus Brachybacter algidus TaxID=2982024 RepID=UPI001B4B44F2|nr:DUF72 domain-containing protein [Candidatus Brachybacter algidus]MBP7306216.1 DUF72 domain-containing protein [Saprospiraceae bacterium]MBK6449147.1 DUF72 domain-containing protein [Candidatus Brachybacter algidus]MBK7602114.1 DUF72 domain-containing protein [Candidatus Brachybacter algidus]MBK8355750.1 DUF72 domain-containing protein [Candidatus Brachybacter algidus]MBP8893393.1 DUF72 domain-containing protein [Saprospiraceae bacterium]
MDFGKLEDITDVDFALPSEDKFYFKNKGNNHLDILLGATGWSMTKWKGNIYPPKSKTEDFARLYSEQFATIEFNTTYYQVPPEALMERWYNNTTPDFVFCPKMFVGISQSSNIGMGSSILPDFLHRMTIFKEKLGLIFMQMPQSFSTKKMDNLVKFIQAWRPGIPLSIELRHESFFEPSVTEDVAELMAKSGINWMITDVAGRREVSHGHITAPFMGVRFVGNDDESDLERIDDWIERLLNWQKNGVEVLYFFIHTPQNLTPHRLCDYFAEKWMEKTGRKLKVPVVEKGLF